MRNTLPAGKDTAVGIAPIEAIVKRQRMKINEREGARWLGCVRNILPAGKVAAVPRQARDDVGGRAVARFQQKARASAPSEVRSRAPSEARDTRTWAYSGSSWLAGKLAFSEPYFAEASISGCICEMSSLLAKMTREALAPSCTPVWASKSLPDSAWL